MWKLPVSLERPLCQMMFFWSTQVKGCFAKADTWKNCFLETDTGLGCFAIADTWCLDGYKYDPQAIGTGALFHFALPCHSFSDSNHIFVYLHCVVELHLWWHHREKLTQNHLVRFLWLLASCRGIGPVGELLGFFWIALTLLISLWCLLSGLDCSC